MTIPQRTREEWEQILRAKLPVELQNNTIDISATTLNFLNKYGETFVPLEFKDGYSINQYKFGVGVDLDLSIPVGIPLVPNSGVELEVGGFITQNANDGWSYESQATGEVSLAGLGFSYDAVKDEYSTVLNIIDYSFGSDNPLEQNNVNFKFKLTDGGDIIVAAKTGNFAYGGTVEGRFEQNAEGQWVLKSLDGSGDGRIKLTKGTLGVETEYKPDNINIVVGDYQGPGLSAVDYALIGTDYDFKVLSRFPNVSFSKQEFENMVEANVRFEGMSREDATADVLKKLFGQETDVVTYSGLDTYLNNQLTTLGSGYTGNVLSAPNSIAASLNQDDLTFIEENVLSQVLNEHEWLIDQYISPINEVILESIFPLQLKLPDGSLKEIDLLQAKIIATELEIENIIQNGIETVLQDDLLVEISPGVWARVTSKQYQIGDEVVTQSSTIASDANGDILAGATAQLKNIHVSDGVIAARTVEFIDEAGYGHKVVERQADGEQNALVRETITVNGQVVEGNTIVVPSTGLLETLGFVGGAAGNLLGNHLADGNAYQEIIYSAFLKSVGEHFGTFSAYLAQEGNTLQVSLDRAMGKEVQGSTLLDDPGFSETFLSNLQGKVSSVLASIIVEEVGDTLGLDGVVGELFDVAAGTVTTGIINGGFDLIVKNVSTDVYANLLSGAAKFSDTITIPDTINGGEITVSVGDYLQFQVFNAIGAYAGSSLAGEVVAPESQVAGILGSIGAAYAGAVGTSVAGGASLSLAVSSAFSSASSAVAAGAAAGSIVPIIGTAIGAFVGTVVGTVFGNALGGQDNPAAWAQVTYDYPSDDGYLLLSSWSNGGGDEQIAISMANSVLNGVNNILDASHGKLRAGAVASQIQIGWQEGKFLVRFGESGEREFSSAGNAISWAAFKILKDFDLVGGHAVVMRAWHNSDAENIHEFKEDIEVAEAFQLYLMDPTSILALMMNDPESDLAQSWAAILQRAAELKLHLPHEKDLDGGWEEILLAQGYDPESIPEISGEDVIIIDPVTGEETVIHHVIGPGYEIVRIEGTDGNDIIEVIVDGPSITYIDAGNGDDTVVGTDQADVIVGGSGDDTIDGLEGNDWLHGGAGDDTINGDEGDDLVVGGDDNDILNGGADDDTVYGSYGDDIIFGDAGTDHLFGGEGNDSITGGLDEVDYVFGEGGNDTLYGQGKNILDGGTGDDTYLFNAGNGDNVIVIQRGDGHDTISGSAAVGRIEFGTSIGGNELFFQQVGDDLKILILGEDQSVTVEDFFISVNTPYISAFGTWWIADNLGSSLATISQLVSIDAALSEQPSGINNFLSNTALAAREANYDWNTLWRHIDVYHKPSDIISGTANADNLAPPNHLYWSLYGESGDDTITTSSDTTTIHEYFYGDAGNDHITGKLGDDTLVGGLGNDTLLGGGHNDRLFGGDGDDVLSGQDNDDLIMGGFGNDTIIEGVAGNDTIYGGEGNDQISTVGGNSSIYGDAGNDMIDAGSGIDSIEGGSGNDTIDAGAGDDNVEGGDGDDNIEGGDGDDVISGGDGTDTLIGGQGVDIIYGGLGNDLIKHYQVDNDDTLNAYYGGEGQDKLEVYLTAQEADDVSILLSLYSINNFIQENIQKPSFNQLTFTATLLGLTVAAIELIEVYEDNVLLSDFFTSSYIPSGQLVTGTSGVDTLSGTISDDAISGAGGNDILHGLSGNDDLYGDAGNDFIEGGIGQDNLFGGLDDDILRGQEDDDVIEGNEGDDNIEGGTGNDVLSGDAGDDGIQGDEGDDVITGGVGDDTLNGGSGNDNLDGGLGNDALYGGLGDDILYGGDSVAPLSPQLSSEVFLLTDVNVDTLANSSSINIDTFVAKTISISFETSSDTTTRQVLYEQGGGGRGLNIFIENGKLYQGAWNYYQGTQWGYKEVFVDITADTRYTTALVFEATSSSTGTLTGYLDGALFDDVVGLGYLYAHGEAVGIGQMKDESRFHDNNEYGDGHAFTGEIDKIAHYNEVLSTTDLDDLNAYMAYQWSDLSVINDQLFGGNGNDTYILGEGHDVIDDPLGVDTLSIVPSGIDVSQLSFSQSGDDLLIENQTGATTRIKNFYNGSVIEYLQISDIANLDLTTALNWSYLADSVDNLQAASTDDIIIGNDLNNTISGNNGDDIIFGGLGSDTLYGGYHNDILIADSLGGDTIHGEHHDDIIYGSQNNWLYGDDGDDLIILHTVNENWIDGGSGVDTISFENITVDNIGSINLQGERIHLDDGSEVVLGNMWNAVGSQFSDNIVGTSNANMLDGGAGSDYLYGGDGDDFLYGGGGIDMLYGQNGADTFIFEASSAFTDSDNVQDFDLSTGDKLDVSDLLIGYDALTDAITDFVQITESGSNSYLNVDADGGADNFVQVAYIYNETGLTDEDALETSGNLITV